MRSAIALGCLAALACGRTERGGDGARGGATGTGGGECGEGPPPREEEIRTRPSELLGRLRGAGLDPSNLPPLDALSTEQKESLLMPAFARALGVQCGHCHEAGNFAAPTRNRAVARRMYEDFVGRLRLAGGTPIFCDSCHARQPDFLPSDREAACRFMRFEYGPRLERIDGRAHDCKTCHGDPPRWEFLPTDPG